MASDDPRDLVFNVAGLLRQEVGATRDLDLAQPSLELDENTSAHDLKGAAHLLRINTGILVDGQVSAEVILQCSRCLILFDGGVTAPVQEEFRPSVDMARGVSVELVEEGEVTEDFFSISGNHELDLTEVVRQSLLVSLPYSPVCTAGCAGLCPECGADLNALDCGHVRVREQNPWSGLAALLEQVDD